MGLEQPWAIEDHGAKSASASGSGECVTITASTKKSISLSEARARSLRAACLCAKAAEDTRGKDTLVLDLTDVTPIADYFVITTGTSGRQMKAVAEEVDRVMRASGNSRPRGVEGQKDSSWILHDFGDVVLHVFNPEARKLYDLEHLWADAPRVDWKAALDGSSV
jgi:ribosome-associated protein